MLNAILEGKAGRITLNEGMRQSWQTVFQSYEDLLTAAIDLGNYAEARSLFNNPGLLDDNEKCTNP